MKGFWQAWQNSTIITGAIVLMFGATACYIWATGEAVPDALIHLIELIVGAFIGAKFTKTAIHKAD